MIRTQFTAMALAAAAILMPGVSSAQVSININVPGLVSVAPPPPRAERVPAPRRGEVWVPGRWQWTGNDYDWRGGYWERARPDYAYAPGRWVRADGGWRWVEGDWKRKAKAKHKAEHRGHDDDRHGGGHCPPGQAKKGRC